MTEGNARADGAGHPEHVHVDHLLERVGVHRGECCYRADDSGIGHHHVDPAEPVDHQCHCALDRPRVGDISDECRRVRTQRLSDVSHGLLVAVDECHPCTFGDQAVRGRLPDTRRSAGDHHHLVGEVLSIDGAQPSKAHPVNLRSPGVVGNAESGPLLDTFRRMAASRSASELGLSAYDDRQPPTPRNRRSARCRCDNSSRRHRAHRRAARRHIRRGSSRPGTGDRTQPAPPRRRSHRPRIGDRVAGPAWPIPESSAMRSSPARLFATPAPSACDSPP